MTLLSACRRRWFTVSIATLLLISGLPVFAREHPNIVFIVTDDQGPWAMGAAGDPNAVTPNMDRLRAEGTQLTHCYTPTPVCSPARV
ncbi:MAG: sulfatase-like hydrolase/transferase, partial [Planctomycetaceae bacterium]